ncbi:MAG: WhiB family transcriptional regulator [Nitriliruptoraceae bacterium]
MHATDTTITIEGLGSDGPAWAGEARCRNEDPALFFGPNRFEPKRERIAREEAAKAICRRCPCLAPCREHALVTGEAYGVWGGLGEVERRELMDAGQQVATAV